jgi:hypothetical protein
MRCPKYLHCHLFYHFAYAGAIAKCFAFFAQLHSVSFDFTDQCFSHNNGLQLVIEALRNLTSPNLQELTITLQSAKYRSLNGDTWSELNSVLETSQFSPPLRVLVFRFQEKAVPTPAYTDMAREKWIKKRFPSYAERGILQIEHQFMISKQFPSSLKY